SPHGLPCACEPLELRGRADVVVRGGAPIQHAVAVEKTRASGQFGPRGFGPRGEGHRDFLPRSMSLVVPETADRSRTLEGTLDRGPSRAEHGRRDSRRGAGPRDIGVLLASLIVTLLLLEGGLRIYHQAKRAYERYSLPPVAARAMVPSSDPELIYEWN